MPLKGYASLLIYVLVLAGLVGRAEQGVAQPQPAAQPEAQESPEFVADLDLLRNGEAARLLRSGAARRLLGAQDPGVRRAVAEIIARAKPVQSDQPLTASQLVLEAIAGRSAAPAWIGEPLVQLAQSLAPGVPEEVVAALASVRTQAAAHVLAEIAASAGDAESRARALNGLRRMTGRDLGDDVQSWSAWLTEVEFLPEAEWRRVLWEGLAARSDELARLADAAIARIVEAKRREFIELPENGAGRAQLLAALLVDELPPLRRLGADLVQRELANGRRLGDLVVDSTVELLSDPAPEFRASAADLLAALAPPQAGTVVADALAQETDPRAAGAMLRAVARWPRAQSTPIILHWLESNAAARLGAIDAAAALRRAGYLDDPADKQAVAGVLRQMTPTTMPDDATWLLIQVGGAADRDYVASWLKSPSPALRLRAAEALASTPDGLDALLAAAREDPSVHQAAARAVAEHRRTARGFEQLASLPAPSDEARVTGLMDVAGELSAAELVQVAEKLEPLALREAVLAPLAGQLSGGDRTGSMADKVHGIVMLARTRLALGQPAGALDALEAINPLGAAGANAEVVAPRAVALLWLNRIPEAEKLDAPAPAWLDALEYARTQPHAKDIAGAIKSRFAGKLTQAQQDRLASLIAGL